MKGRKLVMWLEADTGSEQPLTSFSVTHPGSCQSSINWLQTTPRYQRDRDQVRKTLLKPWIKMHSVIQIWTFLHLSQQLHTRGLFSIKNVLFLCICNPVHATVLFTLNCKLHQTHPWWFALYQQNSHNGSWWNMHFCHTSLPCSWCHRLSSRWQHSQYTWLSNVKKTQV